MDVLFTPATITAFICGYLIGSIPFGLLLTKAAGMDDIRAIGSGNIGATNVLRTGNKYLAAATLLLDMLKGLAATVLAFYIASWFTEADVQIPRIVVSNFPWMVMSLAGLAAFLGHLFPIWLSFKGGKGVATMIGVLTGLASWPIVATFCAAWLATALLTRYSSLSALTASATSVIMTYIFAPPHVAAVTAFMTTLLIWKHRKNIERLMAGEEPKIGEAGKTG